MTPMPKTKPWRSPKYLKWLRSQPCYYCGRPSTVHHIKGIGHMSGISRKAPDWATSPLCEECHHRMQTTPLLWPEQWEIIARTLGKAVEDGVLTV